MLGSIGRVYQDLGLRKSTQLYESPQTQNKITRRLQHSDIISNLETISKKSHENACPITCNSLWQGARLLVSGKSLGGTPAMTPHRSTAVGVVKPLACENIKIFCGFDKQDKWVLINRINISTRVCIRFARYARMALFRKSGSPAQNSS